MALRAIDVLKDVCAEMEELCPDAWIFNYTNPVNIVAEAITHHSPVKVVSLCEGPIYFRERDRRRGRARPASSSHVTMVGLNHGCWGVEHDYDGARPDAAARGGLGAPPRRPDARAARGGASSSSPSRWASIPADYFEYYYFTDEVLAELRAKPTTRAEDILALVGRLLAPLRGAGADRRPAARPGAARAAASTSSSSRST